MKTQKFIVRLIMTITVVVFVYLATPKYIKKAIIYVFPGIEDYEIFKNRKINTGDAIPWAKSNNYMQYELKSAERDTLEHYKSIAYLVIKNDSILYEEYWDSFDSLSISNSFSAAKSVVGLLLGAAIQDGYIANINQSIGEFIPEFNKPPENNITIKNLLTMSSGLNWNESYINPFSMTTQAYYGDDINQLVLHLESVEKPGKEFKYLSGNTQLLSIIIKNATGKTLSEYLSQKLWMPLGAEKQALWSLDKADGDEKAYCCLNSNARDFARIGKLILNQGKIKNEQIISEDYIKESIQPAADLVDSETKEAVNFYGYQWWILNDNGQQIPYARGIKGQYIFVLEAQNAIVVRLGHKRSKAKIHHHPSEIYQYISTAKNILNQ